jgi:hypothetical protein
MKVEIMKRMPIILVVICAGLAFASATLAVTPGPQRPGKTETITGRVSEVGVDAQTIVVIWKKAGMTLDTASARMKGYRTMSDIKPGDKVMVKYAMREGRAYAKVITKRKSATGTSSSSSHSFRRR